MRKINELSTQEVIRIVERQRWFHENVHISYMCYWLKITETDFWLNYHWNWVDEEFLDKDGIPNN